MPRVAGTAARPSRTLYGRGCSTAVDRTTVHSQLTPSSIYHQVRGGGAASSTHCWVPFNAGSDEALVTGRAVTGGIESPCTTRRCMCFHPVSSPRHAHFARALP